MLDGNMAKAIFCRLFERLQMSFLDFFPQYGSVKLSLHLFISEHLKLLANSLPSPSLNSDTSVVLYSSSGHNSDHRVFNVDILTVQLNREEMSGISYTTVQTATSNPRGL